MRGFKKWEEKGPSNDPFTHDGTGTSKCGTGTKLPLPLFFIMGTSTSKCGTDTKLLLPLIPVSIPVLTGTNYSGTGTTLQKFPKFSTFWISLYARFLHCFKPPPN